MATTVLEELIVKFMSDSNALIKDLDRMRQESAAAAKQMQEDGNKAEKSFSIVEEAIGGVITGLAALGAKQWLAQAEHEWGIAETTALRLNAAIESSGRSADVVSVSYRDFASELQNITVIGDDATLAVLGLAESYELSGEAAITATRNATALAAITGGSASSLLRMTAAIQKGDVEMAMHMARMVPQLRGIKDETEFLDRANRLFAQGMAQARAEAQTYQGQVQQLSNAYGDLMEEFGKIRSEGLKPYVAALKDVVAWVASMNSDTKFLIVTLAEVTVGVLATTTAIKALGLATGYTATAALGLKVAIAGFAAYAALEVIKLATGMTRYNQELQRSVELTERLNRINARRAEGVLSEAAGISDPSRRAEFLQDPLQQAESNLADLRRRQQGVRENLEATQPSGFWGTLFAWGSSEEARAGELDRILQDVTTRAGAAQQVVDQLRQAMAGLNEEAANQADNAFRRIVDRLEEETDALGEQAALRRDLRALGENASEDARNEVRNRHEIMERRRVEAELQQRLREQDTSGLSQNWRDAIEARDRGLEQLAEEFEWRARLEDAEARATRLEQNRRSLAESVDPLVRYERQVRELNEQMASDNPLTQDQHARLMARYADELGRVGDEAGRAASAVERFNAVASGSTAASDNFAEYLRGATSRFGRGGSFGASSQSSNPYAAGYAAPAGGSSDVVMNQILEALREIRDQGGVELVAGGA